MKSIERRFRIIENMNPHLSSFVCYGKAVSGCSFSKPVVTKWFYRLVEKDDYSKSDSRLLVSHLQDLSENGDYYDTRFWSSKFRNMPKYSVWRSECLERDNYSCIKCGSKDRVEVDHIKQFKDILLEHSVRDVEEARKCEELWDVSNGRTLCHGCRMLRHSAKNGGKSTISAP